MWDEIADMQGEIFDISHLEEQLSKSEDNTKFDLNEYLNANYDY